MQIVLSILQFLGWILLAAVFILLVVILILLFHPVRYLVNVQWLEEQKAKFQARWLFRLIRAKISYGDALIYGEVYLFWKRITFSFDLTEKNEKEASEKTKKPKEVKESKTGSDEGIISKIKGMIERIKAVYPKVKKLLTDEKNQEAVRHIKNEIICLFKSFLPKKSKIDAVFSTGAPDTTGQVFGILACFPAMYQKNWKIIPDFVSDDLYFKGTIWGKGRIYGCEIVGNILRIILDKNCRRMYTMVKRFLKWFKKSDKVEGNING